MKQIYNFINKYKKEIIIILILIIICIGIYYFYSKNNYEGFFTTTTPITIPKWEQLGQDIDGEKANDRSGKSVSLNGDGTIVAIGAYYNEGVNGSKSGHVRVYQYDENTSSWTQLGQDIDGEADFNYSGHSVSLSSDGTIVAIGATSNHNGNGINSGHVRVFEYNENDKKWNKLGDDIDGEAEYDKSGYSVSLSSNGTILAIGAIFNDGNGSNSGHVRIFEYNETTGWNKLGDDIDGESSQDKSGYSVSLSSNGTILAIGAIFNDGNGNDSGHVRIYKYDGTSWELLGQEIDGEAAYDNSGHSVSLSADGKIVAIGAYDNDGVNSTNSGHVRIFELIGNSWTQKGSSILGENANDKSGYSVSLSSDGTIVAIGAYGNDGVNGSNSGHVRVYQYDENTSSWTQLGQDIDGEAANDDSGYSVSLSSDGTIVAIGAYGNDGVNSQDSGHVKIYKISPIDCVGSFVNEGNCSKECGTGTQKQIYQITTSAQYGGGTCPYEDSYEKEIDCNTQNCPPIDCVGEYQNSGECVANDPNLNCGPGTQQQEYKISQSAENGGSECPVVATTTRSISCNLTPCPIDCEGSFGEYETCSVGCGGGSQARTYTITKTAQHGGEECPHQDGYKEEKECNTDPCPINCAGDFEKLGECSRECGGGVLRQFYDITTEAQYEGVQCDHKQNDLQTMPCNTQPCPTYPENTTLQEALKESNNKIQNIRYNIIDRQEELDTLTNKFNILNKNISFLKHNKNYVPDDKTLTFY